MPTMASARKMGTVVATELHRDTHSVPSTPASACGRGGGRQPARRHGATALYGPFFSPQLGVWRLIRPAGALRCVDRAAYQRSSVPSAVQKARYLDGALIHMKTADVNA